MTTWVLLAGLPGAGKSTLAQALERRLNEAAPAGAIAAVTLNKDLIRSTLFPGGLTDYTPEQDDLCMRAIFDAAAYLTALQRTGFILIDGRTFSRRLHLEAALQAAEEAGAGWRILHLICPDEVAEARLAATGHSAGHPAQNRSPALYRRIKREFEPIARPKLDLDSTLGIASNVEAALRYLQG